MTTTTTFVPSGSPVTITPLDTAMTYAMPTVDGSNVDTQFTNSSSGTVYLSFANPAAAGSQVLSGELTLPPTGKPVLVTPNAATVAASAANPLVVSNPNPSTAANVSIIGTMRGGSVTIQRGTATPRSTF